MTVKRWQLVTLACLVALLAGAALFLAGRSSSPSTTKTAALALPTAVPAAAASATGPSPVNGSIEFISGGHTTSIPANALVGLLLKMTPEQLDGTTVQITHDGVIHTMSAAAAKQSLLKFEATADVAAARSDVRSAIPAAEGYYQIGSTYTGMTIAQLQAQAPGVTVSHVVVSADGNAYCLDNARGSKDAYYIGGDQNIGNNGKGFATDTGTTSTVTTGALCATLVSG